MKQLYISILFLFIFSCANAQTTPLADNQKMQNIEALKIAFISRQLDLTPDEAQRFWPVYNQYSNEIHIVVREDQDVLDRDQKVLDIRKSYRDQFIKILDQERTNRLFEAEGKFRQLLIQAMQRRQGMRQNGQNQRELDQ
ncbi:MAG TPA: hypothetical protein VK705_06645 [Ferruginibacter sp.]|jgi:hypothetical protein|nr:hypothetical protein [Ferruginibacter sp.]